MSRWIYTITSGSLDANVVFSTGRIKVLSVHVSNATNIPVVIEFEDDDNNALFEIVCGANDTSSFDFGQPVDFDTGLKATAISGGGGSDVNVSVVKTRNL